MGCRHAEDAAVGLLRLAATSRSTARARATNGAHLRRHLSGIASGLGLGRRRVLREPTAPTCTGRRRAYATQNDSGRIAVVGGGLTGLTTAYYLAKQLPASARITLYEGSDRLGGWIRTDRVPVDVDGTRGTVSFERGPRTLSSLHLSTWRFDDLVLYDLVRRALPGAAVW